MVAVGCETEPVSNNDEFLAYRARRCSTSSRRRASAPSSELEDERVELSAKLGENIAVAGARPLRGRRRRDRLGAYAHPPANKLGVLVQLRGGDDELARKLAMHISWSDPRWIGREDVPEDLVAAEKRDLPQLRRGAVEARAGA